MFLQVCVNVHTVKYNLIKKEYILNFQRDVYDHNAEGFSEVADEHKGSVAGLAAL